jgi:hypothetical protein
MLNIDDFFAACTGLWVSERTYHYGGAPGEAAEIERSHTEFRVRNIPDADKRRIVTLSFPAGAIAPERAGQCPGFAIAFDTVSEKGEKVAMELTALFVSEQDLVGVEMPTFPAPVAAQVGPDEEILRGYYLRDEGYSEGGAIAGRFTYQPSRHTLEMMTVYSRSVAVDQMRLIDPTTRLRTIVTYQRPPEGQAPSIINLIGFGVERKG